jgi:hypothetical protein
MLTRDYRDVVAGAILVALGIAVTAYATSALALGSVQRMGPGMFPAALGVILSLFGMGIAIPALFRSGTVWEQIEWRPMIFVAASIAGFALTVQTLGLIPATLFLIGLAHLAETQFKPRDLFVLLIVLPGLAYLIFGAGLGLTIPMLRWPF